MPRVRKNTMSAQVATSGKGTRGLVIPHSAFHSAIG